MTARNLGLLLGLAALAVTAAHAIDKKDTFERPTTLAVALTGGDTISTYQVLCNTSGAATQIRPAVTDRSRRRIRVANQSPVNVLIGSSTVIASNFWIQSSTSVPYDTNSSAAILCGTQGGVLQSTVTVIEETQSIP